MIKQYKHTIAEISELKMYRLNNKNHPQNQIDMLASLIQKVGFTVPIAIDEDNFIISGHGRYLACKQLGITKVPALILTGFTDAEIKEYRIFDNRISDMAEYNLDNIRIELQAIDNQELNELFDEMFDGVAHNDEDRGENAKEQKQDNYDFTQNQVKTIAIFCKYQEYEELQEMIRSLCDRNGYKDVSDLVYNAFKDEKDFFAKG